jgi:dTDP-4-dehydrorhamnose reductase
MEIIVTGCNGQLGTALKTLSLRDENKWVFLGKNEMDITVKNKIEDYLKKSDRTDSVLINCAAYTDVERAETEPEKAYLVNAEAVKNLAQNSLKFGYRLIHVSTDFVFDGIKGSPYTESDRPVPLSVYGKSKYKGELEVLTIPENGMVIRTSWLYSTTHNTFMKKVFRKVKEGNPFSVVSDETGSPTNAHDLAEAIIRILQSPYLKERFKTDIFHFCNTGEVSRYEYAEKISEFSKEMTKITPILSKDLKMKAERPRNSSLDNGKIIAMFRLKIRSWEQALLDAVSVLNAE